jgi:hypothetical protein
MRIGLALKFIPKKAYLDRMGRELKVEPLRRPLYVHDEKVVVFCIPNSIE